MCIYVITTYIHYIPTYFVYPHIWFSIAIIILNQLLDQQRIIKISLHFIFSCITNALPLRRSLVLIYVIFLLCEECLLAFLTGKTTGNKFLPFLVWETLCFSFTFTEQFHRVQDSMLMFFFFFFNLCILNISLHFIFAFMVSWDKLNVIFIFASL